ncbi:MAG: alpha/beta fold hydrolase [Gemmatimonadaceae bacterium]
MRGEFVDVGGVRLYYYAAGTRGGGDPIVLVHGFGTSSLMWRRLIPLLPTGRRIVAVDLLGYGRSDRPFNSALGSGAHADRLRGLLAELRIDRACFIGHDLGATVAHRFSQAWPALVSRLCLVDPTAGRHWAASASPSAGTAGMLGGPLSAFARGRIRARMISGFVNREAGARACARYLKPFSDTAGGAVLARHTRALRAERFLDGGVGDARTSGKSGAIPTAIVCGAEDPLSSLRGARMLAAALPGADLYEIKGMGHFSPEEAPTRVSEAVGSLLAG